jgi:glycosyltransferase involved in cell wall biosynthesis
MINDIITKMRILLVDVNCKQGSTGKIIYDLYTELNKIGYLAAIAFGRGPVINEPRIFKFSSNLETIFHVLMTRIFGIHGFFSPISTYRLIKFIKRFNPDIVHLHDIHGYFVNIVPLVNYLKRKNIKTVWTFHSEFMYEAKGYSYSYTEDPKWIRKKEYPKSILFDFSKWSIKVFEKAFQGFTNLVIVSPSKWIYNKINNSFYKRFKNIVIHNGINQDIFKPRDATYLLKKHNLLNKTIILSVAPNIMDERKGGYNVLQLSKMLVNYNFHFILIGVNDLNLVNYKNVTLINKISDQSLLAEYYSIADFFLILSKKENFPTTCLEALSCGTPIIGFSTGGTSETAPLPFGNFYPEGDLITISQFLIKNPKLKSTYSQQIQDFKSIYNKTSMLKKHLELYKSISKINS